MAFTRSSHLTLSELDEALRGVDSDCQLMVTRVRSQNKGEIRRVVEMSASALRTLIHTSVEDGHMAGGDLEVLLPGINRRLVGHHDGVFWLEASMTHAD